MKKRRVLFDTCVIIDALQSREPFKKDAVMIETATRSGIDCIVTRNVKDYKKSPLPIYTPSELLTHLDGTVFEGRR